MFQFDKSYSLSNEIAQLQPLEEVHKEELFSLAQDKAIWQYFLEKGMGKENFYAYIARALENREKGLEYPFIIKDARQNRWAGLTRIYNIDNTLKIVKIGHTWIGKPFQGTGLNKACKYLLFEFLFDKLAMERIGFGASEENQISIRAMRSVGCQEEGRLRSFMPGINGIDRVDIVLMSILKADWEAKVKKELHQKLQGYHSF